MDDLPEKEPSGAWLWYLIGIWALLAVSLIMLGTGTARAQTPHCGPLEAVIEGLALAKESIVWEGTMPTAQGPVEVIMFQSEKGTWTLVAKSGTTACFMAMGTDGTPIETGKGV